MANRSSREIAADLRASLRVAKNAPSREDEIAMMAQPSRWPHWRLPLKRRGENGFTELAVLITSVENKRETVQPTVFLCSLYESITRETTSVEYASFDALVDDGWRVD